MTARSALVVGAGIAGSTLAVLLGRAGIDTTVVDHDAGQRSSGNPVDVRGLAIPLAEQMGVLAALRAAATRTTRLAAVDAAGREIGWIPVQTGGDGSRSRGVTWPRSCRLRRTRPRSSPTATPSRRCTITATTVSR